MNKIMKAYLVVEAEDFCTGAYCFGHNKYEFYFKSKNNAEIFMNGLKNESDNEVTLNVTNVEDLNEIHWMD